jgi:hypothetical protein
MDGREGTGMDAMKFIPREGRLFALNRIKELIVSEILSTQ